MNCSNCKHYIKTEYPFHCELAKNHDRFSEDCMHGISHYEPKEEKN